MPGTDAAGAKRLGAYSHRAMDRTVCPRPRRPARGARLGAVCARPAWVGDPPDRDIHATVAGTVATERVRRLCAQGPDAPRCSTRALSALENAAETGFGQ